MIKLTANQPYLIIFHSQQNDTTVRTMNGTDMKNIIHAHP